MKAYMSIFNFYVIKSCNYHIIMSQYLPYVPEMGFHSRVPCIFKNFLFLQKKVSHRGLKLHQGEYLMTECPFWGNYSLKMLSMQAAYQVLEHSLSLCSSSTASVTSLILLPDWVLTQWLVIAGLAALHQACLDQDYDTPKCN